MTDFDRHTEIFEASYSWAKEAIAALEAGGSSAIQAILDTGALERRQAATTAAAERQREAGAGEIVVAVNRM